MSSLAWRNCSARLVEFGIERDDAAVGIVELLVELLALLLAACGSPRGSASARDSARAARSKGSDAVSFFRVAAISVSLARGDRRDAVRQMVADLDGCAFAGLRIDPERVHQPARADQAQAHAAWRAVLAVEDGWRLAIPGPCRLMRIAKRCGVVAASIMNSARPPPA